MIPAPSKSWPKTSLLLAGLLACAACQKEEVKRDTATTQKAAGTVLGGAISDDMIPLDQLRSQAPRIREAKANAKRPSGDSGPERGQSASEGEGAGEGGQAAQADQTAPPANQ